MLTTKNLVSVHYHTGNSCYASYPPPVPLPLITCSVTQSCLILCTSWTATRQASLSFTISQSLLKLMCIKLVMPSNHLILCRIPFSSCLQSFPAAVSFPTSWLFASGAQSIGASTLVSVLPLNIQAWYPFGLSGLISLQSRDSQESSLISEFESINSSVLSFL